MSRSIAFLILAFALPPVAHAQWIVPQEFTPWKQAKDAKGQVYYHCHYNFAPLPGDRRSNLVVWYPTDDDIGYYYYTSSKDKYWCRALNSLHKDYVKGQPKWNVIGKEVDKKERISDIAKEAWGPPEHPLCTDSDVPMKEAPPPPFDAYQEYFKLVKGK